MGNAYDDIINEMIEEINKISEEGGDLDRHSIQYICEKYIKKTADLYTK